MNPLPTGTHPCVSSLCAHSQAPLSAEPSLTILPSLDPPPDPNSSSTTFLLDLLFSIHNLTHCISYIIICIFFPPTHSEDTWAGIFDYLAHCYMPSSCKRGWYEVSTDTGTPPFAWHLMTTELCKVRTFPAQEFQLTHAVSVNITP